jgi:hypothetical protein
MSRLKSAVKFVVECFAISLIVALADLGVVYLFVRDPIRVVFYLSMTLLLEGGLGLLVGGVVASFSRVINKIGEKLHKSESWTAISQREAERNSRPWIVTGVLLLLFGFLVSAF